MNGYLKLAKDIGSPLRFESGCLELNSDPGLGVTLSTREMKELAVA
jgi:hypothetical protein